jgi:hypothetical protein
MNRQLFVGGNMNSYININNFGNSGSSSSANSCANGRINSINHNNTLHSEHYSTMDLCSQGQMSEDADNILSRMDKLRAFAREQQAKRVKSQRQQTSFCF